VFSYLLVADLFVLISGLALPMFELLELLPMFELLPMLELLTMVVVAADDVDRLSAAGEDDDIAPAP
jgi:hypothetical protein